MNSKEMVLNTFQGKQCGIPWIEIHIDDELISQVLYKRNIGWMERVEFAKVLGLDAIGISRWDRFGRKEVYGEKMFHPEPMMMERSDLDKFMMPGKLDEDAIRAQVIEAKKAIGDSGLALFVAFLFCLDPVLVDMGVENFSYKLCDDPEFICILLEKYTQYNMKLAKIYSEMDEVDFIWIGEDIAFNNGPFVSPKVFRELVMPYFKRIANEIKKPWIYHSDGNILPVMDDLLSLGMNGINPIQPDVMDIYSLKDSIGKRVTLVGNLDVNTISLGSKEENAKETTRLMEQCGKGGRYIFSSSNSLPYYVNKDNLLVIGETKKNFNKSFI